MHTRPVQDAKAHFSELLHARITQGADHYFMRKRNGCSVSIAEWQCL